MTTGKAIKRRPHVDKESSESDNLRECIIFDCCGCCMHKRFRLLPALLFMNYLAHAYLSFDHPPFIIGNMIADFVKGKQLLQYDENIQRGIRLHRAIDTYTDHHPATRLAKTQLKEAVGAYSGVYTDVIYDHFLANDDTYFTAQSLAGFAENIYEVVAGYHNILPPMFQQVFSHMRQYNWLVGYRHMDGISKSFNGITRRARYLEVPGSVPFKAFEDHYDTLKDCYVQFFPDLVRYVKSYLEDPDAAA